MSFLERATLQPTGCLVVDGCGSHRGKRIARIVMEERIGPLPSHVHVHHLCGERNCIEPAHLLAMSAPGHMREHYDR